MTKKAYIKRYLDMGYYTHLEVFPTGRCKIIKGGPNFSEVPADLVEVQRKHYFGLVKSTFWIRRTELYFFEDEVETIYDCDCMKDIENAGT